MPDYRSPAGVIALLATLTALTGCPPDGGRAIESRPPIDVHEALARVNSNLSRLNQALVCRDAEVSFSFRDSSGKARRFRNQPAALIFRPPRDLYFDITSLGGTVAHVGSNQERYWLWVETDVSTMWWGTWASGGASKSDDLPLPPDRVLTALALSPLPGGGEDPAATPLLHQSAGEHHLLFVEQGPRGPYVARDIQLDARAPYLPVRIIDRDSDGSVIMDALLGKYRAINADGPFTPRRYEVKWPRDDAEMHLDLRSVILRADQPPFSDFPGDPPVRRVVRVDRDASDGFSATEESP